MSNIKYYKLDKDDILEIIIDYMYTMNEGYEYASGILLSDKNEIRFVGGIGKENVCNCNFKKMDKELDYNGEHSLIKNNQEFSINSNQWKNR